MPTQGNPFTDDDLQRPSHEGRSLHDEVSNFFRGKLEISSPITASNLPKSSKVAEAFKMVLNDESDERFTRLLLDLQATKLNDLWPGHSVPPPTKEGVAWHAAHSLLPKQQAGVSDTSNMPPTGSSNTKKGGRTKGSKGWKDQEYDKFLDAVDEIVPTGMKKWELVAAQHYLNGYNRSADNLKRKFDQLWSTVKPTGSAVIPRIIERAKTLKDKICREEVIGRSKANDLNEINDSDEDLFSATLGSQGIEGTNLVDTDGNFRRPATKKRRSTDIATAISELAYEQSNSASILAASIDKLAGTVYKKRGNDFGSSDDMHDISKVDALEKKTVTLENKIDKVLEYLVKN